MNWYLEVLRKYAVFSGRARRKEYWMFVLFNMIITLAIDFTEGLLGGPGAAATLYGLAVIIPSWAVSVRRLHDVGKSGWFLLVLLIPIIGGIWILALACTDGQQGENRYGWNPKTA